MIGVALKGLAGRKVRAILTALAVVIGISMVSGTYIRSVIAEGFVIGLLASILGLLAGIGLAKGLMALFAATGVELPDAATVIAPRTLILSIVVGTLVTVVASILPARRATRVPPIAAVREGSTLPPSRFAPHAFKVGLGVVVAAVAAVTAGLFGGLSTIAGVSLLGGGVLALFLGMALLAPRLVAPLARFVGAPARKAGGVAGELAGRTRSAIPAAPPRRRPL